MDYIINGNSLKTIFKTKTTKAVKVFFPYPDRKDSQKANPIDINGIRIDLADPKYDARLFTIHCVMSGSDIISIQDTYFGLFSLLRVAGVYSIYNDYVDMTVFAYYIKQQNLTDPKDNNEGGITIEFDLVFGEADPFLNIPNVFLVDMSNRFLVP